ncbi:hypothetical protein PTH_2673 [Pelotomaculum thermopropionicum SI]|uniref:Uncharacterized protein n=1 Tax=Pelotomaculum thermopropionicum (strain DSM 13744 / JCM 10971 / SI) TaxID=370438 RepID=A5CYT7_PELTS|nr:hypothetical protein PTH_2673 [Pelotomaculum thermopropionicum SI]
MDFKAMSLKERANYCLNIYYPEGKEMVPKCADNFNENEKCGYICCGHCPDYDACEEGKCKKVWIDPYLVTDDPKGRIHYVVLETGRLVSGSVPCLISEMYDDNG